MRLYEITFPGNSNARIKSKRYKIFNITLTFFWQLVLYVRDGHKHHAQLLLMINFSIFSLYYVWFSLDRNFIAQTYDHLSREYFANFAFVFLSKTSYQIARMCWILEFLIWESFISIWNFMKRSISVQTEYWIFECTVLVNSNKFFDFDAFEKMSKVLNNGEKNANHNRRRCRFSHTYKRKNRTGIQFTLIYINSFGLQMIIYNISSSTFYISDIEQISFSILFKIFFS